MNFKLKTPVTVYEVYQNPEESEIFYKVRPITLGSLKEIMDLGRTASWTEEYGYNDLYPDETSATIAAYNRTLLVHSMLKDDYFQNRFDDCDTCCDDCDCEGCGSCGDCHCDVLEPSVKELYPMDEYPAKLVKFDSTKTIRLFRRRPGQKPSANCAFITSEEVKKFKIVANIKSNYSLTQKGNPKMYAHYCDVYFD